MSKSHSERFMAQYDEREPFDGLDPHHKRVAKTLSALLYDGVLLTEQTSAQIIDVLRDVSNLVPGGLPIGDFESDVGDPNEISARGWDIIVDQWLKVLITDHRR